MSEETTITEPVLEMRTIQDVLDDYVERGNELKVGLNLTDGFRTWGLDDLNGFCLRVIGEPGHQIGGEAFKYVEIANLRMAEPEMATVYRILFQCEDSPEPRISYGFHPSAEKFMEYQNRFLAKIVWAETISQSSKKIKVQY